MNATTSIASSAIENAPTAALASLSSIAGMLSIICWFIVFTPQLWINYKNQSGESLSLPFLYIWLAGDFFNVAGATLDNLLLTMRILAWYYTVADILLIIQVYYYRRKAARRALAAARGEDDEECEASSVSDEESALLGKRTTSNIKHSNHSNSDSNSNVNNHENGKVGYSSITSISSPTSGSSASDQQQQQQQQQPGQHISWSSSDHSHPQNTSGQHGSGRRMSTVSERARALFKRRRVRQALMIILPTLATAFFIWSYLEWRQCIRDETGGQSENGFIMASPDEVDEWWGWTKCSRGHKLPPAPDHGPAGFVQALGHHRQEGRTDGGSGGHRHRHPDDDENPNSWLPVFLGWGSAVLYLGSRVPQLYKNWVLQSCEGLSVMMFIFSVFGNVLFVASILLNSLDPEYLIRNMPWWLGSTGTLIFDIMIFCQFYLYKDNTSPALHHKNVEDVDGA
ncbi:hypothetical protein EDD11_004329 [Mortierella claussenii]|nr:hypothetical protein EDD11_004329 [Mortierella claussenii]